MMCRCGATMVFLHRTDDPVTDAITRRFVTDVRDRGDSSTTWAVYGCRECDCDCRRYLPV